MTGAIAGLSRGHGVGRGKEGEGSWGRDREVYIVILKYREFVVTQNHHHLGRKPLTQPHYKHVTTPSIITGHARMPPPWLSPVL